MRRPSKSNKSAFLSRRSDDAAESQSLQASQARAEARQINSQIEDDGIIIVTTRKAAPSISLEGFLLLVASFFLFKGVVIAWLGAESYAASIQYLQSGTFFDQAAAFIMAPDFLSQFLALQLSVFLS